MLEGAGYNGNDNCNTNTYFITDFIKDKIEQNDQLKKIADSLDNFVNSKDNKIGVALNKMDNKFELIRQETEKLKKVKIGYFIIPFGFVLFIGFLFLFAGSANDNKNKNGKKKEYNINKSIDILAENSRKESIKKVNEKKVKKEVIDILAENSKKEAMRKVNGEKIKKIEKKNVTGKIDMLAETTREAAIIKAKEEAIKRKEKEERNIKIRANKKREKEMEEVRKKCKEINKSIIK